MKAKLAVAVLVVFALAACGAVGVWADGWGKGVKHDPSLEDKFYDKVEILMAHQDHLGISDDQMKKVKEIKIKTKKEIIKTNADIDIIAVDLKAAMWEDPMDTAAIDKMLDKKYDLKKQMAKTLVAGCAEIQNILTKDQKDKLKALMKEHKKSMGCCPMMKGGKCPMMEGDKSSMMGHKM